LSANVGAIVEETTKMLARDLPKGTADLDPHANPVSAASCVVAGTSSAGLSADAL